jgi:hypothetical protein
MVEWVFRLIIGCILTVMFWLALTPIVFVIATPVLMFLILFKNNGTFMDNLMGQYRSLWKFWKEWGLAILFPPI